LDHFVSVVETLNKKHRVVSDSDEAFQIISRASSDLPPSEKVETKVFYDPSSMEISIATAEENCKMEISKIRRLCSNDNMILVPTDMVQRFCGFPFDTIPPLGHCLAPNISKCKIIFDERLVKNCRDNKLLMIGGAGHPYWKSLLTAGFIARLQETGQVRIAGVITCNDDNDDDQVDFHQGEDSDGKVWEVSSTPMTNRDWDKNLPTTEIKTPSNSLDRFYPKPYFPIDGPSINVARLVVRQKEISNPLTPIFLTVMGRIGIIKTRTKRSLRCEFLPPLQGKSKNDEMNNRDDVSHPWRSATCNRSMEVDLIFAKVFLQSYGTKQGEALIEQIQEGALVQIEAKTNPGQRESMEKWVDTNCLELTLIDCQLLSYAGSIVSNGDCSDGGVGSKGGKKTKKVGSSSNLPVLALGDVYEDTDKASIEFVNDADSVSEFSGDVAKLLSALGKDTSDNNRSSLSPFVGIDCEWQPREFMENKKQPQPVLLLQIGLHALERVYILDLQALLRPLKTSDTPMNQVEQEVSDCLFKVLKSKCFVKVGYQLSSDLRRVFASYPHLPCFQEVHSALEISSFIKRVLHISKQKKSRYITMSLASMASHYLGMTLDKEHQMTDWAVRDLTPAQLEYAALDAAVPPKLLDKVLESIGAHVSMECLSQNEVGDGVGENNSKDTNNGQPQPQQPRPQPQQLQPQPQQHLFGGGPVVRRQKGDDALVKEIVSMRFLHLAEHTDERIVSELRAKQIVGPSWIASSVWTAVENPPPPPFVSPSSFDNR